MDAYFIVKTVHIISATILFGTGLGIAFFMFLSLTARNIHERAYAARITVLADFVFTAPAVIVQPATGFWLVWQGGYDMQAPWLVSTYALYILTVACWVPVVWLQLRMKKILTECTALSIEIPRLYHRIFRMWVLLGCPAFLSLVAVFYLMVAKPS